VWSLFRVLGLQLELEDLSMSALLPRELMTISPSFAKRRAVTLRPILWCANVILNLGYVHNVTAYLLVFSIVIRNLLRKADEL